MATENDEMRPEYDFSDGVRGKYYKEYQKGTNIVAGFNMASHFVDRHVEEGRGDHTAVLLDGQTWTYAQVQALVNRSGNALKSLGLQAGDRVLLVLPDSPEFIAAFLGAIKIGCVAVPTSTFLRTAEYAHAIEESEATALVVHESLWSQVSPALDSQTPLRHVILAGGERPDCTSFDALLRDQSPDLDAAATSAGEIAFWLWTSGSTGPPKAAVHRQSDCLYCCECYARHVLDIGADDLTFSSSKLFHAYGLGNALFFPFHTGARTALFPGRPSARVILEQVEKLRPTLFYSVPTLFAAMLHEAETGGPYDLRSVRLAVSAAEPLPAEIYRRWKERFGCEILDGLGSTEALHMYVSARQGQVRPGSSGFPLPGYEVRITDERGALLPTGQVGDMWVRGNSLTPYYWKRPDLSSRRICDGWFFTGDKYRCDEDGYLWYAGRSDDMFRVSGEWVSPIEVEAALTEHPAVLEAAVVPWEDENALLKPRAFVVLKGGGKGRQEMESELQQFVKDRLASYKCPRRVVFLDELPKTATGKIQRYKLRQTGRNQNDEL